MKIRQKEGSDCVDIMNVYLENQRESTEKITPNNKIEIIVYKINVKKINSFSKNTNQPDNRMETKISLKILIQKKK